MAAPVMPSWKVYMKMGKKSTADRFPNPATSTHFLPVKVKSLREKKLEDIERISSYS